MPIVVGTAHYTARLAKPGYMNTEPGLHCDLHCVSSTCTNTYSAGDIGNWTRKTDGCYFGNLQEACREYRPWVFASPRCCRTSSEHLTRRQCLDDRYPEPHVLSLLFFRTSSTAFTNNNCRGQDGECTCAGHSFVAQRSRGSEQNLEGVGQIG